MSKLTPQTKKTIRKVTEALKDSMISMTIDDLVNATGSSPTVIKNTLAKIEGVKQDENGYYLPRDDHELNAVAVNIQEAPVNIQDGELNTQAPQVSYPDNDQATLISEEAPLVSSPVSNIDTDSDLDWSKAPQGFNWWAKDKNGTCHWYSDKPRNQGEVWGGPADFEVSPNYLLDVPWHKSVLQRPNKSSTSQATETVLIAEVNQPAVKKKRNKPFTPNLTRGYEVQRDKVKIFLDRKASSKVLTLSLDDLKELVNAVEKSERVA